MGVEAAGLQQVFLFYFFFHVFSNAPQCRTRRHDRPDRMAADCKYDPHLCCSALLCYAMRCSGLLCSALLCFALAGWSSAAAYCAWRTRRYAHITAKYDRSMYFVGRYVSSCLSGWGPFSLVTPARGSTKNLGNLGM